MSRVEPAGRLLDVVDVVDLAVLRHRLFPAVRQWSEVRVMLVVVQLGAGTSLTLVDALSAAAGGRLSVRRLLLLLLLLGHALHVLVPDRRSSAAAAASSVATVHNNIYSYLFTI